MLDATSPFRDRLPDRPGVGYKPQHFEAITRAPGAVGWIEIHAENYMGDGGRPLAQLRHLAERFPISVHGVGLSIGGEGPLDRDHLARLAPPSRLAAARPAFPNTSPGRPMTRAS